MSDGPCPLDKPGPVLTGAVTFKFTEKDVCNAIQYWLNEDVCNAIQYWLNEEVLKNIVTVSKVEKLTTGFEVTLKEDNNARL